MFFSSPQVAGVSGGGHATSTGKGIHREKRRNARDAATKAGVAAIQQAGYRIKRLEIARESIA